MTEKRKIFSARRKRAILLFVWGVLLWIVTLSAMVFAIFTVISFFFWSLDVVYSLVPFFGYMFRIIVLLALFLSLLERHHY